MLSKVERPYMLSRFFGEISPKYKYLFKKNKLKEDPKSLLVSNYSEVKEFLNILNSNKEENKYKQLYLNVTKLFDILYAEQEILNVEYEDYKNLSDYYYLVLLIKKNKDLSIDFSYSFDFIKKINKDNEKNDKPLRQLLNSKIILDLIKNYRNLEIFNEYNEEKEIKSLENENKLIIRNNFNILKNDIELNLEKEKVIEMEIDDLYVEIIYTLMKNKKIEDYKFATKIFKQMNLDSINISKEINEKYLELSKDNNYVKKYLISTPNHLSCPKKIFHYFILFNYIFKDSLYIYQNPFLFNTKKNINNIIKKQLNNIDIDMPKKQFKKFKNVVEKFLDCDYYKNIFNNYLEKVKQEKLDKKIRAIYLDINKNKLRYDKFYPDCILRCKYSSTYITLNVAKVSSENFQINNNENILVNNDLPIEEYLYANPTFEDHRKEKLDKNNKSKNYFLIFIEQINSDKFLIEDKNFKHYIHYCLPNKKWDKMLFSDKSHKEFKINENLVIYIYNKFFEGEEDKLEIYNKTSQSKITEFKDYCFPFGLKGFAVINNNILICPCKKNEINGILYIYCENDKIFHLKFEETKNFKVTSICPLLNDKLKETNYFLIAGVNANKKVKIQLAKFIYDCISKNIYIKIIETNIAIKKDENFCDFQKPIYQIKQSKITGHIFMYSEKKISHFSPPNLNKYLILDKNEKSEKFSMENSKLDMLYEEYVNKCQINDCIKSIYSSENN